jgi:hypothetical protein
MSLEESRPSTAGSQRGPESRPSTAGSQRGPESRPSTAGSSEIQSRTYDRPSGRWTVWDGQTLHNQQQGVGGQNQDENPENRISRQREHDLELIEELEDAREIMNRAEDSQTESEPATTWQKEEEEARTALFKWREDALKKQNEEKDNK